MADVSINLPVTDRQRGHGYEPTFGDYFALLKPRVMSLVVFTALVGILAAPSSLHWVEAFAALLFIAVGAGASGALNMWWDADIDAVMRRTAVKRSAAKASTQWSDEGAAKMPTSAV
ncbi:MAG: UbiA family prenyltransferase, partial [Pseudomonadota bacterium]